MLNLTKVAVGCASVGALTTRNRGRTEPWRGEAVTPIHTRYRPKRHEELVGGSLYWIIRHVMSVRQPILGFEDCQWKGKPACRILLAAAMVPVVPRRKRAHQGWRYLKGTDAPADLTGGEAELGDMPPEMIRNLASLGLL